MPISDRRGSFVDTLWSDLRYALRQLRRAPTFFLVASLTLALAIGGSTAIFGVVHAVLLRPLPFPEPDRLVRLFTVFGPTRVPGTTSPTNFLDWRTEARSFDGMAIVQETSYTLTGHGDAEELDGARVSPSFFEILRVPPLHGRAFAPSHEQQGNHRVVVLSYGAWQRRFGGDPAVLGSTLVLDGESYEVIGIARPGVEYPAAVELWTPWAFDAAEIATQRGAYYVDAIGRLAPGATVAQADLELRTIADRLAREFPRDNDGTSAAVEDLRESHVGDFRQPLFILLGAVGLVLLVACANVAGLLLSRSIPRERELSIRTAVGASRARLVRQLLTESVLLAILGVGSGILLASWGTEALVALRPRDIPRLEDAGLSGIVLAFSAGLGLVTTILFGLLPALQTSSRIELAGALREGGSAVLSHRRGNRLRSALVVGELALSLMLLVGAGLLLRSFAQLHRVDTGFEPERVITYRLSLPSARYAEPDGRIAFVEQALESARTIPGVERAGVVFGIPMSGFSYGITLNSLDGRVLEQSASTPSVQVRIVTPDYFETVGMRLQRGRGVMRSDRLGTVPVLVVSDSAARMLWPDADPIGRSLVLGTRFVRGGERAGGEVVGVVADTRERSLDRDPSPIVYLPYAQNPTSSIGMAVRARGDVAALVPALRARLAELDADVAMYDVQTLEQRVAESVARPRYYMVLLGLFAAVALTLAVVGVYGLMAFAISQRTREIGIRIALGARQGRVLQDVLQRGLLLAVTGLVIGIAGALAATRLLESLLFGVDRFDTITLASVALLLAASALLACYVPARRASRVDPLVALRTD